MEQREETLLAAKTLKFFENTNRIVLLSVIAQIYNTYMAQTPDSLLTPHRLQFQWPAWVQAGLAQDDSDFWLRLFHYINANLSDLDEARQIRAAWMMERVEGLKRREKSWAKEQAAADTEEKLEVAKRWEKGVRSVRKYREGMCAEREEQDEESREHYLQMEQLLKQHQVDYNNNKRWD